MSEVIALQGLEPISIQQPSGGTSSSQARAPSARPLSKGEARPRALPGLLPPGRLIELSGERAAARTTTAVSLIKHAQARGEVTAWVQPRDGALYPPDLDSSGVDLGSLVCVHVPTGRRTAREAIRAAETLVRSGAFGLVVVDLTDGTPPGDTRWQGRLAGVVREHGARLVVLTDKPEPAPSLGPLVGVRVEPRRDRDDDERFAVHHTVLKAKVALPGAPADETHLGPEGV